MKVQITLSLYQLQLIKESLAYTSISDKLLDKKDPSWIELIQAVYLAHDRLSQRSTHNMTIEEIDE